MDDEDGLLPDWIYPPGWDPASDKPVPEWSEELQGYIRICQAEGLHYDGLNITGEILARAKQLHAERLGKLNGPGPDPNPPPRQYRFPLCRFDDIRPVKIPRYIVEDLIPTDGLVVVWGPPKCGKSFAIFDLAMHVAQGWEYRAKRVEQGAVVYIAAEGERGIKDRAEAFRQRRMTEGVTDAPFYLLTTRLDLVKDIDQLLGDVKAQLPGGKCSILVLDTLNRTIHGSESSDEDMGAYRDASDRLREEFHCTVIIIHHCGIDGTRPRGHTSLTGALDAQFAVKRDVDKAILVTLELMKDGPEGEEMRMQLELVEIGIDDYGKPITSCVIEHLDIAASPSAQKTAAAPDTPDRERKPARKLPDKASLALAILKQAIYAHGIFAQGLDDIKDGTKIVQMDLLKRIYLSKTSGLDQPENTRRVALLRALDRLQVDGMIGVAHEMVWIA